MIIAGLLYSVAARAEALSLAEALERGVKQHPLVRRAQASTGIERSRRVQAKILMPANPWASVLLAYRPEPEAQGVQAYVHAEQQIEIAGQRGTRIRAVDAAVRVATLREELARTFAKSAIRSAYAGALLAIRLVEEIRSREELAERLLTSARARVQAGAASDVELHLATAERGRVAAERLRAEAAEKDQFAHLRRNIGAPLDAPLELSTAIPSALPALLPAEQLIDRAQRRRMDLQALLATQEQLDREIVRYHREAVPNPSLFFEYWRDFGSNVYGGGLILPFPLWRRNQGDVAQARAEKERAQVELDIERRTVADEVAAAYRSVRARSSEVELYEKQILPAIEKQLQLVEAGWRAGKFDLFRVMVSAQEVRQSRLNQLNALGNLWQAVIELDRSAGEP